MITALCANPCIDMTLEIDAFNYGGMNRVRSLRKDGSGKGVNIAIACTQLGMESNCISIAGQDNASLITDRLFQHGCGTDFVMIDGEIRTNMKLFDRSTSKITEVNQSGLPVDTDTVDLFIQKAVHHARSSEWLVLTGSIPPGCPTDIYQTIIAKADCKCVLDAEGEKLSQGLKARPYMVKPNDYELEMLMGHKLESLDKIHTAALSIIDMGITIVAVSLGSKGAYITDGKQAYFAPSLDVQVRSTVGAGDSMVAGFIKAADSSLEQAFRSSVAAATSSVTTSGTQLIDIKMYQKLLEKVEIQEIKI